MSLPPHWAGVWSGCQSAARHHADGVGVEPRIVGIWMEETDFGRRHAGRPLGLFIRCSGPVSTEDLHSGEIVGVFRSAREGWAMSQMHGPVEWCRGRFNGAWFFEVSDLPNEDGVSSVTARLRLPAQSPEEVARGTLCDLQFLPPPLEQRGVAVFRRRIPGLSLDTFSPADVSSAMSDCWATIDRWAPLIEVRSVSVFRGPEGPQSATLAKVRTVSGSR